MKDHVIKSFLFLMVWVAIGCGHGDEDFSDTAILKKIIKDDQEAVFNVEVADDAKAVDDDTTTSVSKTFAMLGKTYHAEALVGDGGLKIGRIVKVREVNPDIQFINDTTAFATVTYSLNGQFVAIYPNGDGLSKNFTHTIVRFVTFVRRENPITQEEWSRVSVSAAVGLADNSKLAIDSLIIITPNDTIVADNRYDLVFLEKKHIVLKRGDLVTVEIVADNVVNINENLYGRAIVGRNKIRDGRNFFRLAQVTPKHYARTFRIPNNAPAEFNQLTIDIITNGTIYSRLLPYDSFLMLIPFRVVN
ncbi:hypothetical protein K1X84_11405 [bacterium]|nr:hypothetical protein [bacterium]